MARLEHANLVVTDIDASITFISTALPHWRIRGEGQKITAAGPQRWAHVGNDDSYVTLNEAMRAHKSELAGVSVLAHLGIEVDDVDVLIERLRHAGYPIDIIGAAHPFRKTVYFVDPSGVQFEFIQYLSTQPAERNLYGGETTAITVVERQKPDDLDALLLVKSVYEAVDQRDTVALAEFLHRNVRFKIGNFPQVEGKEAVVAANQQFFASISGMRHCIESISCDGEDVFCKGTVSYLRLDGSPYDNVPFATVLQLQQGEIIDYQVYVDVSAL